MELKAGRVAQVEEHLHSKHEVLSSNSSATKKKKKERKKMEQKAVIMCNTKMVLCVTLMPHCSKKLALSSGVLE
jgi:hypothetical protein